MIGNDLYISIPPKNPVRLLDWGVIGFRRRDSEDNWWSLRNDLADIRSSHLNDPGDAVDGATSSQHI